MLLEMRGARARRDGYSRGRADDTISIWLQNSLVRNLQWHGLLTVYGYYIAVRRFIGPKGLGCSQESHPDPFHHTLEVLQDTAFSTRFTR